MNQKHIYIRIFLQYNMELLNNECLHRILGTNFHGTEKFKIIIILCWLIYFYSHSITQTKMGLSHLICLYSRNCMCIRICIRIFTVAIRTRIWVRCNPTKRWQEVNLKYHYCMYYINHCWTNHHKKENYKILT